MPAPEHRSLPWLRFAALAALLYLAFILPWPGAHDAYARGFCAFARLVCAENAGPRVLRFNVVPPDQRNRGLDTSVTIANRALLDARGTAPAVRLDLDSRGIGFLPTALTLALVLATPLPWPRRLLRLIPALAAIHALIALAVHAAIWSACLDASQLAFPAPGPFAQAVIRGLDETFVVQLGASFVVPFLVWAALCLRPHPVSAQQKDAAPRLAI